MPFLFLLIDQNYTCKFDRTEIQNQYEMLERQQPTENETYTKTRQSPVLVTVLPTIQQQRL